MGGGGIYVKRSKIFFPLSVEHLFQKKLPLLLKTTNRLLSILYELKDLEYIINNYGECSLHI